MAWEDEYNQDPDKMYGSSEDVWMRIGLIVVPIAILYAFGKFIKFVDSLDPYLRTMVDSIISAYQYFFS